MSEHPEAPTAGAAPQQGDAGSVAESTSPPPLSLLEDPRGFRDAAARLTARLVRRHGPQSMDRVEDAVQDAFVAAARAWPLAGVPREPLAWLTRVAERRYLDRARAERRLVWQANAGHDEPAPDAAPPAEEGPAGDDQLRLLFLCCHPALTAESRVALTLKCVAQFGVDEIARLLRADPAAVAQRLVRAKRTLRDVRATFVLPATESLPSRLDDVLAVCYAIFAEGHLPSAGAMLVRPELCREALRLVLLLLQWPPTARAETQALLALLCLTAARLPARDDGAPRTLRDQDRSTWDAALIARGGRALAAAADGTRYTRYHAEAEIAWWHTTAASWDATPWTEIVAAYDRLVQVAPGPLAKLSRLVAIAEGGDPARALLELHREHAALSRALGDWADWHATVALLHARAGDRDTAMAAYDRALALPAAKPVQRLWADARAALAEADGASPWQCSSPPA